MSRSRSTTARGFLLPSAIFLLVILSVLGAFILNVFTAQQLGMVLDVNGERAWQAANAGMEWARYKLASAPGGPACPANTTWGGSGYSLGFPGTSSLTGFHATVECRQVANTDVQGIPTWVFEVRVTACSPAAAVAPLCPGTPTASGYVERQMQGLISF